MWDDPSLAFLFQMKKRILAHFIHSPGLVCTVVELTCAVEQVSEQVFTSKGLQVRVVNTELEVTKADSQGSVFPARIALNLEMGLGSWIRACQISLFPFAFPNTSLADLTCQLPPSLIHG